MCSFQDLQGRVARLARHKVANAVLELCYNELSNGVQRNHILQEFFGPGLIFSDTFVGIVFPFYLLIVDDRADHQCIKTYV